MGFDSLGGGGGGGGKSESSSASATSGNQFGSFGGDSVSPGLLIAVAVIALFGFLGLVLISKK